MHIPVWAARPTLPAREPKLNAPFLRLARTLLTPAARIAGFRSPVFVHPERLASAYRDFAEGKTRLIVGFRHPYGDDPQLTGYLFHKALPQAARRLGTPLRGLKKGLSHVLFVYGMEVPLWSHPLVGKLLIAIGAVPVDHSHPDPAGMNRIRRAILEGDYPVALAPEGHVTYRSEASPEIESGTARFGFWCVEDLAKRGRDEKTVFIPLSYHYKYRVGSLRALDRLIRRIGRDCGSGETGAAGGTGRPTADEGAFASRTRALDRAASAIRSILAASYGLPPDSPQGDLLLAAIASCERILGIEPPKEEAGPMERFYAMRGVAWDRIFRGDLSRMGGLERNLADRSAGEAWFAMRHMEVAELLYHVDLSPSGAPEGLSGLFERAINLADLLGRAGGGTLADRPSPARKLPVVVVGEPVRFDDLAEDYRAGKKEAIKKATLIIKRRFEDCIHDYKSV